MDFSYSDDQQALFELAKKILSDKATHARMRAIETGGGPRFDREIWSEFAKAGLLGAPLPSAYGGADLGFLEVAGVAEWVGKTTAPIPYIETIVLGALPIAAFGSDAQKQEILPRVAAGEMILTAALTEEVAAATEPQTSAVASAGGWQLRGVKVCVPAAQLADAILVPATVAGQGVGVFVLDPKASGVTVTPLLTTSGQPEARLDLDGAAAALLGGVEKDGRVVAWICERYAAALCMVTAGVCDEALQLTSEYLKTRKQFDQPIGMFQAAGHRAASAYVDTEGVRLTALQAAWRIAAGLPAAKQVHLAKCWAADGGYRVAHAASHLHGGVGVDRDYPLHRYFLYARQLELTLGGATEHYRHLGKLLADE